MVENLKTICLSQIAAEYLEGPSGKKGGDLGWFPRGKMAGPFQDVAVNTPVGVTSASFKSTYVHILSLSLPLYLSLSLFSPKFDSHLDFV